MYAVLGCVLVTDLQTVIAGRAMVEAEAGEKTVRFYTAGVMLAILHLHHQEIVRCH